MVAKGKKTVVQKSTKKDPAGKIKPTKISPFCHRGGAQTKSMAIKVFNEKKVDTPADWKRDFVKDDRWVSYLPKDWTPGLKMTDGGLLIKVYVGPPPERKHFFHKVDLEKFIGRALTLDERGPKPIEFGEIDPKKFIKRKDTGAMAKYIDERCNKVHGMSVEKALATMICDHAHGKKKKYTLADLKYDLHYNRLELVDKRPSKSFQSSSSSSAAQRSSAMPMLAKRSIPSTSAATSNSADNTIAAKIFHSCYTTLKSKAATTSADEKSIYTMIGIGASLGLESAMLNMLPELLKKAPAERGASMQFALDQFEKAFAKA